MTITVSNGGFDKDTVGTYTVQYTVTDNDSGGSVTATRTVTVKGLPSFTPIADVTTPQGTVYDLLTGVTAQDANGDDTKVTITVSNDGGFNKNAAGTYTVEYTATDTESGGSVTAERNVTVV